tara:strand:- start:156 stop:578 length:423 start_codon:yes stop_codon:yes gene_type:complete
MPLKPKPQKTNPFDLMNNIAGNDMYITGGAITMSEYEQNMTPVEQKKYEELVKEEFQSAFNSDPHKGNLDFKHWVKTLNWELINERALKFDDVIRSNYGDQKLMQRADGRALEDAGALQKLAHLHTGRIKDLLEVIGTID